MADLEGYSFGRLTVDGRAHTHDLILLPDRVVSDRWRREDQSLSIEDLDDAFDELPGRLVLGAGARSQLRPDPAASAELRRRGRAGREAAHRRGGAPLRQARRT